MFYWGFKLSALYILINWGVDGELLFLVYVLVCFVVRWVGGFVSCLIASAFNCLTRLKFEVVIAINLSFIYQM